MKRRTRVYLLIGNVGGRCPFAARVGFARADVLKPRVYPSDRVVALYLPWDDGKPTKKGRTK